MFFVVFRSYVRGSVAGVQPTTRYSGIISSEEKMKSALSAGAPVPDASGTPGTASAGDVRATRFRGGHPT